MDSPGRPVVGIGMPLYQAEKYVSVAIEGLLRQTFKNWRLYISDNGSTDATADICLKYAASDSRIVFERQDTNRGAAWNFNRVFEMSSGEYFCWAAGDDDHAPDFLQRCVEALSADPEVVVVAPATRVIDENGDDFDDHDYIDSSGYIRRPLTASQMNERVQCLTSSLAADRYLYVVRHFNYCQELFSLMRRDVLQSTGLHRAYYGSDKILLAEMALRGKILDLAEPLFMWRRHRGQSMWAGLKKHHQHFMGGLKSPVPAPIWFLAAYIKRVWEAPLRLAEKFALTFKLWRYALEPRQLRRQVFRLFGRRASLELHGTVSSDLLLAQGHPQRSRQSAH